MATPRSRISRRQVLTHLGATAAVAAMPLESPAADEPAQPSTRPLTEVVPMKGKAGPGLEPLDDAVLQIMDRHGIPGAALAIAKLGKLVHARGYGWADVVTAQVATPETAFGLASLSKPITAIAVLQLVERGKVDLDAPIFALLKEVKPPRGAKLDARLSKITVRQCLNHAGGWNRSVTGDPVTWTPMICRALKVQPPLTSAQLLSYAMTMPLNFDPGAESQYSNIGYVALGELIQTVSGQTYGQFCVDNVFKPAGAKEAALHGGGGKYRPTEARRHIAGTFNIMPPLQLPMQDAAGGWVASVLDVVRVMTALDGTRGKPLLSEQTLKLMIALPPKPIAPFPDGTHVGLGWDRTITNDTAFGYLKDGNYPGAWTYMKRLPTGINWVLVFNATMNFEPRDAQIISGAVQHVRQRVDTLDKHPDVDLFKDFP